MLAQCPEQTLLSFLDLRFLNKTPAVITSDLPSCLLPVSLIFTNTVGGSKRVGLQTTASTLQMPIVSPCA